jgi:hypothetical protein
VLFSNRRIRARSGGVAKGGNLGGSEPIAHRSPSVLGLGEVFRQLGGGSPRVWDGGLQSLANKLVQRSQSRAGGTPEYVTSW